MMEEIELLFETIDALYTNKRLGTKYNKTTMLNHWFKSPYHRDMIYPTPINDLFILLDRVLLIGLGIEFYENLFFEQVIHH